MRIEVSGNESLPDIISSGVEEPYFLGGHDLVIAEHADGSVGRSRLTCRHDGLAPLVPLTGLILQGLKSSLKDRVARI